MWPSGIRGWRRFEALNPRPSIRGPEGPARLCRRSRCAAASAAPGAEPKPPDLAQLGEHGDLKELRRKRIGAVLGAVVVSSPRLVLDCLGCSADPRDALRGRSAPLHAPVARSSTLGSSAARVSSGLGGSPRLLLKPAFPWRIYRPQNPKNTLPTTVVPKMGTSAADIRDGRPRALLPARRTAPSPRGAASKPGEIRGSRGSSQRKEPLGQRKKQKEAHGAMRREHGRRERPCTA